jgi:DNA-binding MarR family transcriptional regulator
MPSDQSPAPEKKPAPQDAVQALPRLIERMHRRFLDVVRLEMERFGTADISPVQVMMMAAIGAEEISVRDLIERGYYLGSNASYNLKQLVDCGYVERNAAARDKRSARLKVAAKGRAVLDALARVEARWAEPLLKNDGAAKLEETYRTLLALERCWSEAVRSGAPPEA